MPISRKDPHSGAIIYDLTPSEVEVKDLKDTVANLTQELEIIKQAISSTSNNTSTTSDSTES